MVFRRAAPINLNVRGHTRLTSVYGRGRQGLQASVRAPARCALSGRRYLVGLAAGRGLTRDQVLGV